MFVDSKPKAGLVWGLAPLDMSSEAPEAFRIYTLLESLSSLTFYFLKDSHVDVQNKWNRAPSISLFLLPGFTRNITLLF
jgi:hypothetical protein